jgi:MFS family permease
MVPAVFFLVINRPSDRGLNPDGVDSLAKPEAQRAPVAAPATNLAILKDPNFWLAAFAFAIPMSGTAAVLSNLVPFAIDIHLSKEQAASILSIYAVCGLGGKLLFAGIADRVDLRFTFVGAGLLCVLAYLGYAHGGTFSVILAASVSMAIGSAMIVPLWGAFVARVFGHERLGRVMGSMSVIVGVMGMLAPPLFGAVRDRAGSYEAAFLVYAALMAIAIILLSRIKFTARPAAVAEEPSAPVYAQKSA